MNDLIANQLYLIKPEKYLLPQITTYEDIIKNLSLLKHCEYSELLFKKALSLIIEKAKHSNRFRKKDCFKVIKMFRKKTINISDPLIIDNIFYLFQSFISSVGEEDANSLSVALKDITLSEDQLNWLTTNTSNKYVLNRVLRYPEHSEILSTWAKDQLNQARFSDRRSELIGRVLDSDKDYYDKDTNAFTWGVYYSRIGGDIKRILLSKLLKHNIDINIVEVISRLGYIDLLENAYDQDI